MAADDDAEADDEATSVAACRSSKTKARRHIERLHQLGKVRSCGSLQQPKYWVD